MQKQAVSQFLEMRNHCSEENCNILSGIWHCIALYGEESPQTVLKQNTDSQNRTTVIHVKFSTVKYLTDFLFNLLY